MRFKIFIFSFLAVIFYYSCSKDKSIDLSNTCQINIVYEDVKSILNRSCAYSGCHDGKSNAPGDYTTFSGVKNVLINGTFENRVFSLRDDPNIGMPPKEALLFQRPENLNAGQLDSLRIWIDSGFKENPAEEITYNSTIKSIIDNTCAYSGCHNGSSQVPRNYTLFSNIVEDIEKGTFFDRVFTLKDNPVSGMPPERAQFFGRATSLSESEIELLNCWLENDYPEN